MEVIKGDSTVSFESSNWESSSWDIIPDELLTSPEETDRKAQKEDRFTMTESYLKYSSEYQRSSFNTSEKIFRYQARVKGKKQLLKNNNLYFSCWMTCSSTYYYLQLV